MLQSIKIKNFRNHVDTLVTFEKVNSIVGENGTGKTSIIEAINFALSPNFLSSRIDEQDFNNLDKGEIEIYLKFNSSFSAHLADGYTTQEIKCDGIYLKVKRREKAAPNKALSDPFTITHYYIPDSTVTRVDKDKWKQARKGGGDFNFSLLALSHPSEISELPKAFYFNKDRTNQIDIGFNSTLQKITQEYNWRFRKTLEETGYRDNVLHKWNELYELMLTGVDAKKLKDTLTPIQDKLKTFTFNNYKNLELSLLNLEQPFSKSFFSTRENLNQIHHSGLGSGISMVLSFIVLETISSLAKEKLLFLIDEPELHLHPQLQSQLFNYLASTDNQVILSTHSDSMIDLGNWETIKRINPTQQVFPNEEILKSVLKHSSGDKTVRDNLNDLKKFYQDKTVFFRENNEILFARRCLLTEGPAEKYGIKVVANKLGISLDDLTIISCNGKSKINFYQLLCIAYDIPFFTLFDLDGTAETEKENKNILDWCLNGCAYYFKDSFEHLFNTQNKKHKGTETLNAIDTCAPDKIPAEIQEAVELISNFIAKK